MNLVLDTSVLINLERKDKHTIEQIKALIERYPAPASITFMNYFEYLHGLNIKSPKNKETSISFIEKFQCLQTTKKSAAILSHLKHTYEKKGNSFSLADLLIAAQAIENDLVLVTSDKKFQEIEELSSFII